MLLKSQIGYLLIYKMPIDIYLTNFAYIDNTNQFIIVPFNPIC